MYNSAPGNALLIVLAFEFCGLVLSAFGRIESYQAIRIATFPFAFLVGAYALAGFRKTAQLAGPTALLAVLASLIVLLAYTLNGLFARRHGSIDEADRGISPGTAVIKRAKSMLGPHLEPLTLQVRPGFRPAQPVMVPPALLYGDRAVVEIGKISDWEATKLIRECQTALTKGSLGMTIEIHSPGGSVNNAWSMHDQLRMIGTMMNVATLVVGDCISAATYLLLAVPVRQRFATSRSQFMFHRGIAGNDSSQQMSRDDLSTRHLQGIERSDVRYIDMVVQTTGIERSSLERLMASDDEEIWLSADEALALGIIGGIVEV